MTSRALLIGLDGATFTILDPLMEREVMPRLRDLVRRGVRGPLRTVMPPLTPPGWTSLMTGKSPGQHGVFDFFQKEHPASIYFRLATADDIQSPTLWSLTSDQGLRVIALNFPMTFPPPEVRGAVVPGGWMPWRQLRLGCHPPELFDRLRALPSFSARELALDMELEEKAIEGCREEEYADWIALHCRREQRWFDIATHLMREDEADLTGIVFDGVDKLQHLCWRFLDPAYRPTEPSAWHRQISAACEEYFRQLDRMIGELVDLAGPDTTVVLASDHGGGPTSDIFCVNRWLEQEGYLTWAEPGEVRDDTLPPLGFRQLARHVFDLDWERTVAYAATPSSQGIHIVTNRPGSGERMDQATYLRLRSELTERLLAVRHPTTGEPVIADVWARDDLFAGPHEALAPDLTLTLAAGAVVSIARSDQAVKSRPEPAGSHRHDGIFVASGPGVIASRELAGLSIVDVAPFVLYSLGLPIPSDMAGRVPVEALAPDVLRRSPPRRMTSAVEDIGRGHPAPVPVLTAEEEATVLRRLQTLGYVE